MNEAVESQLATFSQELLEAISVTAWHQLKLKDLRTDPLSQPEQISRAARNYRGSESAAQDALKQLLEAWEVAYESGQVELEDPPVYGEADQTTPADQW